MKMSEKTAKILLPLFLSALAALFFFLGYLWKEQKDSWPILETIKSIDKYYVEKFSPQVIKELQYIGIKSMINHLDPDSRFYPPQYVTRTICYPVPIEEKILDKTIGYLKIPDFRPYVTYQKVQRAIKTFKKYDLKGLIIDLRNNPGGNTNEVIKTTELFLEKGKIIATFKFRGKEKIFKAEKGLQFDKPIVILVNNNSASASELLSGALKDHKRAILIGTKTQGKGAGQYSFIFDDGSVLDLTILRFYSPNGNCPQDIGINPDITITNPDLQFQKAIEILKTPQQRGLFYSRCFGAPSSKGSICSFPSVNFAASFSTLANSL